ncbi:tyrosine-type recombinase/integrase [Stutzerimonas kunmingensis]|uniref:tyrosine-type recombinase/integrase n=1 Tax=Stutzerimonas kunmingensis TaxID=1211807 RepID=UPI00241DB119|nr:integrase arm-type DNA-binding domain-containing protein [Stutzerimonas kunmingensis]
MPTLTLDATTVRSAVCPSDKRKLDLYDTAIPGFVLEVRPSGGKTWYLRYRDARGKQHQHRIGDASGITFEQARNAALTVRARVILGESPAEEKKALRAIPTLEAFAKRYLDYVKGVKRSWDTDECFLRNHVLPRWGKRHLDEIRQQDIIDLQHGMRASGYAPATANRIVILTRYMWNLGKKWKVPGAEANPASGIELFEENNKRERFLSAEEAQRLMACVRQSDTRSCSTSCPCCCCSAAASANCSMRSGRTSTWNGGPGGSL